ncbi:MULTISPECIES: matrixin family metalloprotease [unclassified Coleofasciculus]|uniref:matrixin family metalloprotease n=1 Tax=unclassified Coleofasciculus TaxID=2692782 RepID=UPI00187DFBB8|nr:MULTISPECIES: matrixin family metalloprotease [unclassified Coleofasciculus]MBE9126218.1 peptidase [Coleofasciculus sp. LEGE 07081]MBE9148120.1 peptidase [Coleofasciculus sp. LEGE 07092]
MKKTTVHWLRRLWKTNGRRLIWLGVVLISTLVVLLTSLEQVDAHRDSLSGNTVQGISTAPPASPSLPMPQVHPLPPTLAHWQDSTHAGDYFSEIKLTPVNYLVWSQFPVKVYVERPKEPVESSASAQRFQNWMDAVLQAVGEWNAYLPLEVVSQSEGADIAILRSRPPLQASLNRETGKFDSIRARTAETRYEFYLRQSENEKRFDIIAQKFTIQLSPDQSVDFTIATARHELGHALGIWGHSPVETDALYFSQVRNPPGISARDINTLKRIYQQPTRLGWTLEGQG